MAIDIEWQVKPPTKKGETNQPQLFPRIVNADVVGDAELADKIAAHSGLSRGVVTNVLEDLADVLTTMMHEGKEVSLSSIGRFRLSIGTDKLYLCSHRKINSLTVMEQIKRVPYGMSDFVKVIEQNNYYVDKTMYLPMLEDEPNYLFFIRPRRFGKSIFLSMLHAYYDCRTKDKFQEWFGNSLCTLCR